MDEAAPTTPRTLLWRGTRCLRNDSPALRPCGLRRLCRLFGIDLAARQRETDLVLSIFAGLAPRHGLDRELAPLAVLAHTLVELGDGTPDAGEILLTHPLKRLDAAGNRLLAMVLTLLTVGKGRTDKVEPLLTAMGCATDDPRRRIAVVLAAIVQVARFALRFDPLEIRLPGEPPVLFLIRVRTPLRLRKQLVIHAPLWARLFGKSSLEWFWTFDAAADAPVPAPAPPSGQLFSSHFSAYLQRQARALHELARSDSALDEEPIHDARVILRSLLSVFGSLKPHLRKDWLASVEADLRTARKLLGGVRDTDVLLGHIRDYVLRPVPAGAPETAEATRPRKEPRPFSGRRICPPVCAACTPPCRRNAPRPFPAPRPIMPRTPTGSCCTSWTAMPRPRPAAPCWTVAAAPGPCCWQTSWLPVWIGPRATSLPMTAGRTGT